MKHSVENQPPFKATWPWTAVLLLLGCIFVGFFGGTKLQAQSKFQAFQQSAPPLKRWLIFHPFIAKKTFETSKMALATADSMRISPELDGRWSGGNLDAFRHGFWMASLVMEIRPSKAASLGKAYEKGNYWMFRKGKLEDGQQQDAIASEMDLLNNEAGREIGLEMKGAGKTALIRAVLEGIHRGKFVQVAMDEAGRSLDANGNLIPDAEWRGKWLNERTLVETGK